MSLKGILNSILDYLYLSINRFYYVEKPIILWISLTRLFIWFNRIQNKGLVAINEFIA